MRCYLDVNLANHTIQTNQLAGGQLAVAARFAFALGQLAIFGFTLHGNSESWVNIHIAKDESVTFSDATEYFG